MSKQGKGKHTKTRSGWGRRALLVGGIALVVVAGGLWLRPASKQPVGGTPRLVVDRTEVDLGYRRFDTPARVVFTLTNAGDAPLRLMESPPVRVIAGC
jgi:hypothetical protein